ncbi:MAG TPA: azurin [Luteimonas sp.]|nr:azurin [Luteimonas sp.]
MNMRFLQVLAAGVLALAACGTAAASDGCAMTLGASDAMRYDAAAISIPAACKEFTITLRHTGTLPVAAMGHDVVIASAADMPGVLADGIAAGLDNGYVKPGDPRVVAHTRLVGGGETASVTFPVAKLAKDGPWVFFCSFPGHSALMKGTLSIR